MQVDGPDPLDTLYRLGVADLETALKHMEAMAEAHTGDGDALADAPAMAATLFAKIAPLVKDTATEWMVRHMLHPGVRLVYTDSCCSEASALAQAFPSLRQGVDFTAHGSYQAPSENGMPRLPAPLTLVLELTSSDQWAQACTNIRSACGGVVGLDAEWNVLFKPGEARRRIATIQLSVPTLTTVFHLFGEGKSSQFALPASLRTLLEDASVNFVGVNIQGDVRYLLEDYNVTVPTFTDVGKLYKLRHAVVTPPHPPQYSLQVR